MHTMSMVREHEGIEEWLCPTCGRHMLVNWKPNFKRTILQAGDPDVSHNGFRNDVQAKHLMASTNNISARTENEKPIDEARLKPWEMWLKDTGFDNLWNRDLQ